MTLKHPEPVKGQGAGWRSAIVRTFKRGCTLGQRGVAARRWALDQAYDGIRDDKVREANTLERASDFVEDAIAARLTVEQVIATLVEGGAGRGIQRRAAADLASLMAPRKPGPKPRSKRERDPALSLAAELSADLFAWLGARGRVERGYAVEYAIMLAWALSSKRTTPGKVHRTLGRPAARNYAKP